MTRPVLYFTLLLTISSSCLAQDHTPIPPTPSTEKAITTASAFMNAVLNDSTPNNLINLCGLPFCHDDSVILTTRTELHNALTQFITAAARERIRTHPRVDSAYVLDVRKEVMFGMVPMNIYFTVVILKFSYQGKEASKLLILAVQLTDEARVVGIED